MWNSLGKDVLSGCVLFFSSQLCFFMARSYNSITAVWTSVSLDGFNGIQPSPEVFSSETALHSNRVTQTQSSSSHLRPTQYFENGEQSQNHAKQVAHDLSSLRRCQECTTTTPQPSQPHPSLVTTSAVLEIQLKHMKESLQGRCL